jgi:peptidoglycan/LPS O-acetylase OafA/YrhL
MIMMAQKQSGRIFGLDLLRVISIALVLCSHTSWIYPPSSNLLAKAVDLSGFFGVELFFVMSGFLIGSILFKQFIQQDYGYKTIFSFLNRRLIRILPNYYLIIFLNITIGLLIGYPVLDSWKYFFFFQNFDSPLLPFFPESWSLPIKEYGYLIMIVLLFCFSVIFKNIPKKAVFLTVVIGLIIFFLMSKIYYNNHTHNTTMLQWNLSLRSVVIYRIDTVLVGVLFGFVYCEHPLFWSKLKYVFVAVGLVVAFVLLLCMGFFKLKIEDSPLFWNVLCLPLNSIALACFLPFFSAWKSAPHCLEKPVESISKISYSVYLIHYSIVLFLMQYYIDTSRFSMLQFHLYSLAYLTITFFLSYLLFNYFEKPITKLLRTENYTLWKNRVVKRGFSA